MIRVETKPENRAEIRRAVDVKCAELGISRSTFAVKNLQVAPYLLSTMLLGKVSHRAHPDVVKKVNKFVGADVEAWER